MGIGKKKVSNKEWWAEEAIFDRISRLASGLEWQGGLGCVRV